MNFVVAESSNKLEYSFYLSSDQNYCKYLAETSLQTPVF